MPYGYLLSFMTILASVDSNNLPLFEPSFDHVDAVYYCDEDKEGAWNTARDFEDWDFIELSHDFGYCFSLRFKKCNYIIQ